MLKFSKVGLLNMMADLKDSDKLTLVGDQGIYIMCFAHECDKDNPRPLVYAEGCDPEVDADFYENKVAAFGGDDGGDEIATVAQMKDMLAYCTRNVHIRMTATTMRMVSDTKHTFKPAKPAIDINMLPPELRKYVS